MWYLLAIAAGAGHVVFYSAPLPPLVLSVTAIALLVAAYLMRRSPRWNRFHGPALVTVVSGLLIGSAIGAAQVNSLWRAQLASEFAGLDQKLSFRIDSLLDQRANRVNFFARIEQVSCPSSNCPDLAGKRVRLSWRNPPSELMPGQLWQGQVRLQPPRGFVNPGGFDYQAWLLGQRVAATGFVLEAQISAYAARFSLAQVRQQLKTDLLASERAPRFAGIFAALLVGDRSDLGPAEWRVLQSTGTVHLMAISGLHIGLAAFWGYWVGAGLARLLAFLLPGAGTAWLRFLPTLLSCLAAFGYAALAGFAIPTVRALIACLLANACLLAGLRLGAGTLLAVGLLLVTLAEPLAWLHQGFWLSFLAVAVLVYALRGRTNPAVALVKAQLVLSVGLMLPLLALGQWVSLSSPVANLIAVPVVSVSVVPGLLLAALVHPLFPGVSQGILWLLDGIFYVLWWVLQWLAQIPHSAWWPAQSLTLWAGLVGLVGVVVLLSPRVLRLRGLGLLLLGVCLVAKAPVTPKLRVTVLDVGRGLAVVIETPEQTWVYDAGPNYSEQFDAGAGIVAPYLRRQGVREVSLILSRASAGSSGGAEGLAEALPIERLVYSEDPVLEREGQKCHAGQRWSHGAVQWQVLWPPAPDKLANSTAMVANNRSCVLLITLTRPEGPVHILLPGDIDRAVENRLLADLPEQIDLLVAPNHGAATSSSAPFVTHLRPRYVVFSTAHNSHQRLPNPQVAARYQAQGSWLYNTAEQGAVVVTWVPDAPETVQVSRESAARLWFRALP